VVTITSNEPTDAPGDGNTGPDFWIDPANPLHIQLRAERSGAQALVSPEIGRIYTVTLSVTDACGNTASATNTVTVAHNITNPNAGYSVAINSPVTLAGTFWDIPGNRHTTKWVVDNSGVNGMVTAEPNGTKLGKVTGSYKPTTAGVYKLRMNITDQNGVTSYATTNGDFEAYFVAYDPSGGYTYGAGSFTSPAGALTARPGLSDQVRFGFTSNYKKGATNPRGETQLEFRISDGNYSFEFNALNYDYLVVNGAKAQYKGLGKTIINGSVQSGIAFIMTVIDGQATDGGGIDKIRIKIYNKNTHAVIYDNQPGASETDDPSMSADDSVNAVVVVSTPKKSAEIVQNVLSDADKNVLLVYPNPFSDVVTFEFISGRNAHAVLDIHNILGQKIATLLDRRVEQGVLNKVEYLPQGQEESGIFFYRLMLDNSVMTGKIIHNK
jgi:hypothetical protein